MTRQTHRSANFTFCIVIVVVLLFTGSFAKQQTTSPTTQESTDSTTDKETDGEERRRMFRTFKQRRQSVASNRPPVASKKSSPVKSPSRENDMDTGVDNFVGFTLWQMRESNSGVEKRSFTLRKSNGQNVVMRPFRLGAEAQLIPGQYYVFSIESARSGYLYVINRELYGDGRKGEPLLLFPTKDVRSADMKVTVGEVIEIPNQKNATAYFEAEQKGAHHIGETLIIIVSPEPLVDAARLRDEPIALAPDELTKWERQGLAKIRWAENTEATGRPYSEEEAMAGSDSSYKLKEGDPLPQRIYRVQPKAGGPLIVTVTLGYVNPQN